MQEVPVKKKDRLSANAVCLIVFVLFALLLSNFNDVSATPKTTTDTMNPDSKLLQFKTGNHILGFAPDRAYLASMDHALSVQFLGTKGVMPKAETNAPATSALTNASSFSKVVYQNLWDGIDLTYVATKVGITESTYCIAPGADVSQIRLLYNVPVEMQKDGSLKLRFNTGNVTESAPVAWQKINGKRQAIDITFRIDDGMVGFQVGNYDRTQPLIIDPTYQWHTFYGSSTYDNPNSIVTDSSGNVYITGYSNASWNGPSGQQPLNAHSGGGGYSDIFVLKFDSNGAYQWHTFYGSPGEDDSAIGITYDGSGFIYLTGYGSGTQWNGPGGQEPKNDNGRMFILKLDTNGAYQWHTFYGSNLNDFGLSVKVGSGGYVYIMGQTSNTWNGPADQLPLNPYGTGTYNNLLLKLSSNGDYQWHTFYGSGSAISTNFGFNIDSSGNCYLTGESGASWTGPSPDYKEPLNPFSGGSDIYLLKLDSNGVYQWHTFYGSSGYDFGHSIGFDISGNIYILGQSRVSWDGPVGQHPLNSYAGTPSTTYDLVVIKLNSSGGYLWHTFYGSGYSYGDGGRGFVVDNAGNIYIAGSSPASWGSPLHSHSGQSDVVVLKLNSEGAHQWHTFYGSATNDYGSDLTMDGNGNIYVTGYSTASWQGDNNTGPNHAYTGSWDLFVLKLNDPSVKNDFNSDGHPDILWRNSSTGANVIWYMNGSVVTGSADMPTIANPLWAIVGTGDFNNDTKPDILWRNSSTGQNVIWYMNGAVVTGSDDMPTIANTNWNIVGTGDFNNDTKPDILWRNSSTGQNVIWYMNGAVVSGSADMPTIANPLWAIVGTGDFNNDTKPDILWRNSSTGQNVIWYMNGAVVTGSDDMPTIANTNWNIVGR
jgi:hypothetical protein